MVLQNDLTTGDVNAHLLRFAMPLLLSNLLQALYNAVDMYFVGQYLGPEGLAAVSISGSVMNILFMTIAGMSVGVSVVIGTYAGRGDVERVQKSAGSAISLYAICAVCITIFGFFASPFLLSLVATPLEAFDYAVSYLRTIFLGVVFTLGYNLICAFQRGFGDSRSSLLFVAVATCLNAVLDIVFLRVLHWGVSGVALATVISQATAFTMGAIYFAVKKHVVRFSFRFWNMDRECLRELVRIGLPSALQQLSLNVSNLTLNGIVNTYGLVASAAYGIGVKIDSFVILPSTATNDAVASFTSQNLGAGKEERALSSIRASQKIMMTLSMVLFLLIIFFAPQLAGLFQSKDAQVINAASVYLRTSCIMYLIYAYVHPMVGFVKGAGKAMFTFTNSLMAQYLVRIPAALLFSVFFDLGIVGIALAWITAPIFSLFTYGHQVRSGKWREKSKSIFTKKSEH